MIIKILITLFLSICTIPVFSQSLSEAIAKKDTLAALAFINGGADVNAVDKSGSTLLMNACRWADADIAGFLLRHGADANKPRSAKGRSPLMVACAYYSGQTICKMLIDAGADVNAVAQDGTTALMLAAQNAKLDVVILLINRGATAKAKNNAGQTALDFANKATVDDYLKQSVKDTRLDKDAVIGVLQKAVK